MRRMALLLVAVLLLPMMSSAQTYPQVASEYTSDLVQCRVTALAVADMVTLVDEYFREYGADRAIHIQFAEAISIVRAPRASGQPAELTVRLAGLEAQTSDGELLRPITYSVSPGQEYPWVLREGQVRQVVWDAYFHVPVTDWTSIALTSTWVVRLPSLVAAELEIDSNGDRVFTPVDDFFVSNAIADFGDADPVNRVLPVDIQLPRGWSVRYDVVGAQYLVTTDKYPVYRRARTTTSESGIQLSVPIPQAPDTKYTVFLEVVPIAERFVCVMDGIPNIHNIGD